MIKFINLVIFLNFASITNVKRGRPIELKFLTFIILGRQKTFKSYEYFELLILQKNKENINDTSIVHRWSPRIAKWWMIGSVRLLRRRSAQWWVWREKFIFLEIISMISFTKYLWSMVSLNEKINFLIDDKFYKIFSLNAWWVWQQILMIWNNVFSITL